MSNYKLTIKRAQRAYQSGNPVDMDNLVDIYDSLSTTEQEHADKEIRKFMPSWGW